MGIAASERRELSALLDALGPDAPTLCEGWKTRDLAAHLALRERRLDAAPGILLSPLSGYTQRVQDTFASRPWAELVELIRTGPPRWSPYAVPAIAERVNSGEYFVHHEDVRRAQAGWQPREPDPARDSALWRMVGPLARLSYRRSGVGVTLRGPDGTEIAAKRGPNTVTLHGEPGELLLHAFGRDEVRIDYEGDPAAVTAVRSLKRGF
ncbi:MAG: TIGR03085 family metal-binding protein [Sciscionella sp.]